jgi:hypothetical protein
VFTPEEDQIGGPVNKIVLSFGLWQTRFGGRPFILGEGVKLRGDTFTVIGVMPPGFRFPERTDVWVPLMSRYASYVTPWWRDRNIRIHSVLGRLRHDVPVERAQADLNTVASGLARSFPTTNQDVRIRLRSLRDAEVGAIRPYLLLLLAAVALVLSIACVNTANLLLVRAMSREGEMALRAALGATRGRLVRQALTESALLSLLGGALGVALANVGVYALLKLIPIELPFWMRTNYFRTMGMPMLEGATSRKPTTGRRRSSPWSVDGWRRRCGRDAVPLARTFVSATRAPKLPGTASLVSSAIRPGARQKGAPVAKCTSRTDSGRRPNSIYSSARGRPMSLASDLRRIVQDVNPENAITYIEPMEILSPMRSGSGACGPSCSPRLRRSRWCS